MRWDCFCPCVAASRGGGVGRAKGVPKALETGGLGQSLAVCAALRIHTLRRCCGGAPPHSRARGRGGDAKPGGDREKAVPLALMD